jgi:ABC-2 type transport system ATP-binding protein
MSDVSKMVEVRDLKKHFGHIQAVRGVSFDVSKGEVLGFLGPNGAGKSTTMRMITGYLPPSAGTASVGEHDILTSPLEAKALIGYLPENAPAYGSMSVTAFLRFAGEIRGYRGSELADRVAAAVAKCSLDGVRDQTVSTLSKGYRQRCCFAQAILHDPPVLIMDEPTDGLDPNQKHVVREMIKEMASEKAIIVSTHILEEVDAVCSRAIIIAKGKIVANGTPDELKSKSPSGRLDDVFRMLTLDKEA